MKVIKACFLLCILLVGVVKAQNDSKLNDDFLEDPIKIEKGKEQHYFKYTLALLRQDSAMKAFQILSRLVSTGQYSETSKEVNAAMKTINQKITHQSNEFLRGTWKLAYEGHCNYPRCLDSTRAETVIISKRKIRFYENNKLTKTYKYNGRIQVNPYFGFVNYLVMYNNSLEDWIYKLERDSKGKKILHIERYNEMNHGYFAVYMKLE